MIYRVPLLFIALMILSFLGCENYQVPDATPTSVIGTVEEENEFDFSLYVFTLTDQKASELGITGPLTGKILGIASVRDSSTLEMFSEYRIEVDGVTVRVKSTDIVSVIPGAN